MIEWERSISERTAAWMFTLGGSAFVLCIVGMAVAHFVYAVPIHGESGEPLSRRDLMIFFPLGFLMGSIVGARGIWMLRRTTAETV